jgi:uncharacterized integral membrane protein
MAFRSFIMSIILAILFTWFALSNSDPVRVSLLFWSFNTHLSILIFISILVGILFTGLISAMEQRKFLSTISELESKLKVEEKLIKGEKK